MRIFDDPRSWRPCLSFTPDLYKSLPPYVYASNEALTVLMVIYETATSSWIATAVAPRRHNNESCFQQKITSKYRIQNDYVVSSLSLFVCRSNRSGVFTHIRECIPSPKILMWMYSPEESNAQHGRTTETKTGELLLPANEARLATSWGHFPALFRKSNNPV